MESTSGMKAMKSSSSAVSQSCRRTVGRSMTSLAGRSRSCGLRPTPKDVRCDVCTLRTSRSRTACASARAALAPRPTLGSCATRRNAARPARAKMLCSLRGCAGSPTQMRSDEMPCTRAHAALWVLGSWPRSRWKMTGSGSASGKPSSSLTNGRRELASCSTGETCAQAAPILYPAPMHCA